MAMITGDHPATSLAIAREVGIAQTKDELNTGSEIVNMALERGESLINILQRKRVFCVEAFD